MDSKLLVWTLFGIVLTRLWLTWLLPDNHFKHFVSDPLIDKYDTVGLFGKSESSALSGEQKVNFDTLSFSKYEEIYDVLDTQYIDADEVDFGDMQDNALKGFVDAIGDPYTTYLDVKENTAFDEAIQWTQNFEWVGAVVTKKKDGVLIEEVLKNSPAFKAWVQALDLVLRIDDQSVLDLDLFDAVQAIRGPKDSEVVLTIFRESTEEILELSVIRGTIDVPSVSGKMLWSGDVQIGYIELATFWEDTAMKMRQVITNLKSQWTLDGIILDLRWNWWWILPISIDIASFFLPAWDVVTSIDYSIFPDEELKSKWFGQLEWLPVVVLIDLMSASASEIIAGALHDQIDALLIGTQSFGKWSVQTVKVFDDSSSLKFSIGKRYTPNGDNIDKEWIIPDIEVEFDRELFIDSGVDAQLDVAIEEMVRVIQWDN